jgi:transporter family-2 protein
LDNLTNVHPLLFTAGALGASLVFAIVWLMPQVGARGLFLNLLAGQVLGGMILSHYGWLGSPVQKISVVNVLGAAVMIFGVVLATYVRPTP